jgi:dihydrofolate reductase
MRKLKLQMQLSLDGFAAGLNGEMDWMVWDWGEDLKDYVWEINAPVELILLGRKMAEGFIETWASMGKDPETADKFADKMNETSKIIFSKTLEKVEWAHTDVINGELVEEINKLKNDSGGDMIVYGGGNFVSELIENKLIDEFNLFINPVAIGRGMTIFAELRDKLNLELVSAKVFSCGIVGLRYNQKDDQ